MWGPKIKLLGHRTHPISSPDVADTRPVLFGAVWGGNGDGETFWDDGRERERPADR